MPSLPMSIIQAFLDQDPMQCCYQKMKTPGNGMSANHLLHLSGQIEN